MEKNDPLLLVGIQKKLAKQWAIPLIHFVLRSNKSHELMHSAASGFSCRTYRSFQFHAASIEMSVSLNRRIRRIDSERQDACVRFAMRAELAAQESATMRCNSDRIEADTTIKCRELIAEVEELRLINDEVNVVLLYS